VLAPTVHRPAQAAGNREELPGRKAVASPVVQLAQTRAAWAAAKAPAGLMRPAVARAAQVRLVVSQAVGSLPAGAPAAHLVVEAQRSLRSACLRQVQGVRKRRACRIRVPVCRVPAVVRQELMAARHPLHLRRRFLPPKAAATRRVKASLRGQAGEHRALARAVVVQPGPAAASKVAAVQVAV
jgi:hypothetical protein